MSLSRLDVKLYFTYGTALLPMIGELQLISENTVRIIKRKAITIYTDSSIAVSAGIHGL